MTQPPAEPAAGQTPRRFPRTLGGMLYVAILVAAAVAIGVVVDHHWRTGVRMLGGCLSAAALLRLVLPAKDAGMLAVRHRFIDVVVLAGLGVALILLAGSVPPQPA